MNKIYNAIKKYLFKDTKYFFLYVYRYFQDNYHNDCKFYSNQEFKQRITNGKSVIRIGDGEIGLLHFMSIHYQVYSDSIRNDLLKIVKTYNDNSKYILSIPLPVNHTNKKLKDDSKSSTHDYFQCWLPLKITYELIFNKKIKYFDAHAFYRDNYFKDIIFPCISDKKIIMVTNKNNSKDVNNSYFGDKIFNYVICAEKNSYEDREDIKRDIIEIINKSGFDKSNFVILMSAGLSKTIIYDMSKKGYQLLDTGKGLEGYYKEISLEHLI
ncbi:MAG: GT-D fold domain-containing glycosyltransferase [bacterium]